MSLGGFPYSKLGPSSLAGLCFVPAREGMKMPEHQFRYVPRERVPAGAAVGWTPISAPFRWSTWTGQALGEVVIMERDRREQPKEPVDAVTAPP
jgi:hypothetical protein